jgi:hypothetical protein
MEPLKIYFTTEDTEYTENLNTNKNDGVNRITEGLRNLMSVFSVVPGVP